MGLAVPGIEVAYDGNAFRIGSPDTEPCALNAVARAEVASEVVIEAEVTSLVEQIEIALAEK